MKKISSIFAAGYVLSALPAAAQDPGLAYDPAEEAALPPIADTYESGCARADRFIGVEFHKYPYGTGGALVAKFASRIDQVSQQLGANIRGYDLILAQHPKEGPFESFNRGLISCEKDQAVLALEALNLEQARLDALTPPPKPEIRKKKKGKKSKRSRKRAELSGPEFSLT